jgi:hypothetical protein
MVEKYDGPLAPVPEWLDKSAEIPEGNPVKMDPATFVPWCVDSFCSVGSPFARSFDLTAHTVTETGWAVSFRGWNLGGIKATPGWAKDYKIRTGKSAPFYRAHGNKGTGDTQTVLYRAYDTPKEYFTEFMQTFVPNNVRSKGLYTETGRLFWKGGDWFAQMLLSGYRGPKTQEVVKEYLDAIAAGRHVEMPQVLLDQLTLTRQVKQWWAQKKMGGIDVDGIWGPQSKAACERFQKAKGLNVTGTLDPWTLAALAKEVDPSSKA